MVLGEGARIVAPGALLGLAGGLAIGDVFRDLLFDVQPFEPAVILVVSVGLAVLGTLAMMGRPDGRPVSTRPSRCEPSSLRTVRLWPGSGQTETSAPVES